MDASEAQKDLEQANRSHQASVRPPLPAWAPPLCGLLIAGAIALAGIAPGDPWLRVGAIVAGVLLAVLARLVVLGIRARQGVRGLRGPARRSQTTLVISGAAFLIASINSHPETRLVYAVMGLLVGVFVWVTLQRRERR